MDLKSKKSPTFLTKTSIQSNQDYLRGDKKSKVFYCLIRRGRQMDDKKYEQKLNETLVKQTEDSLSKKDEVWRNIEKKLKIEDSKQGEDDIMRIEHQRNIKKKRKT